MSPSNIFKRICIITLVIFAFQAGCKPKKESLPESYLLDGLPNSNWFDNDFSSERSLLSNVRCALTAQKDIQEVPELNFEYDLS